MTVPAVITTRPACTPLGARWDHAAGVLSVDSDWWDQTAGEDPLARVMLAIPALPLGEAIDLRQTVKDGRKITVRVWPAPDLEVTR